jgi:hypothetical protein
MEKIVLFRTIFYIGQYFPRFNDGKQGIPASPKLDTSLPNPIFPISIYMQMVSTSVRFPSIDWQRVHQLNLVHLRLYSSK